MFERFSRMEHEMDGFAATMLHRVRWVVGALQQMGAADEIAFAHVANPGGGGGAGQGCS